MAITRDVRQQIEKERFDEIEDLWLSQMAASPGDTEFFVGTARALVGVGEEERARFLLQMLDTEYVEKKRWRPRLALLREAGSILVPEAEELHGEILRTLRGLHGTTPSFDGFVQAVRLDKAPQDIPKTWEKVERLEALVPFDVGAVVWMEGKGAGRVAEVNLGLDSLKVDFERHPGLTVGFRAAAKLLEPLDRAHVLRRKMDDPEALRSLGEEDPSALLAIVLTSYDKPLTAGEVRENLEGIVDESRWTSWWGNARKHPQVDVRGKGRQTYTWLGSGEQVADAVWQRFEAAEPRAKLALLKREGERDEALLGRMVEALRGLAGRWAAKEPGIAFESWHALDRAGAAPDPTDDAHAWTPVALLGEGGDPSAVLRGIEERTAREAAFEAIRTLREDWVEVWSLQLSREEDPRLLDHLARGLGREAPTELQRFVDSVIGQPHKNPAGFTWVAERAAEDEEVRGRSPVRLLQQLLGSLIDERFTPFRQRLLPQLESGGTVARLLGHLTADSAAQAETLIGRAAGLELYQREALTNALHLKFPELRQEDETIIYSTREAIEAKREELRQLVQEELPANRKAIEEARALGDLRENFEYKSARQRHEYLSSRQAQLERELTHARPLAPETIDTGEVRIGTRVRLALPEGQKRAYTILGPWDSNPEAGILSYESDLAKLLLGKKVGDSLSLADADGTHVEVAGIERYTD